jgi:hypothetical protein
MLSSYTSLQQELHEQWIDGDFTRFEPVSVLGAFPIAVAHIVCLPIRNPIPFAAVHLKIFAIFFFLVLNFRENFCVLFSSKTFSSQTLSRHVNAILIPTWISFHLGSLAEP